MRLKNSTTYQSEIKILAEQINIRKKNILITGATGLIGSCLIDALIYNNLFHKADNSIYAMGRNRAKLEEYLGKENDNLCYIVQDVIVPLDSRIHFDYIIHCASNADPQNYATYPVETILTNTVGTTNLLEYCKHQKSCRLLFTSTFEIYGKHDSDEYKEDDFGYLNQNIIRSGYPESKRTAELLCRSYHSEYGIDCVIARLSSIYGPTMLKNDSKAHAQFIRKGLEGKDIVLKSQGTQNRTYCYVMDAVSGIIKILEIGNSGEAYNVANPNSVVSIAQLATIIAKICNVNVIYEIPDQKKQTIYSPAQNCILNTDKLYSLNWKAKYDIFTGLKNTVNALKESLLF